MIDRLVMRQRIIELIAVAGRLAMIPTDRWCATSGAFKVTLAEGGNLDSSRRSRDKCRS